MKKLLNIQSFINLFFILLSLLFFCSDDTDSGSSSTIQYDSLRITIDTSLGNDTIYYYNAAAIVIDKNTIKDSDSYEILLLGNKNNENSVIQWENIQFSLNLIPISEIRDTVPMELIFFPGKLNNEYEPILENYEIGQKNLNNEIISLKTLNNNRIKGVWTNSILDSTAFYLGKLKTINDSIQRGVTFRLQPTFNGLPGLPDYDFPDNLAIDYEYDFYNVKSIDRIETPIVLSKTIHSMEIPNIVLSFYTDDNTESFLDDFNNENKLDEHLNYIIQNLNDFGVNSFDGFSFNYSSEINENNCEYLFLFIEKCADNYPEKKISFHFPYRYLSHLNHFHIWEKINHITISYIPILPGDSITNNADLFEYDKLSEEFFNNQNSIKWNKIRLEFNPHVIANKNNQFYCYHYDSLLTYLNISPVMDTLNEDDSIVFTMDLNRTYNSVLNKNTFISWDNKKKMITFSNDSCQYYFHNNKTIDLLIEYVQKYNFNGIHLIDIEKNDIYHLSEKLKLFYQKQFYPIEELNENDFTIRYSISQMIYKDTSYKPVDSTFGPFSWQENENEYYQIKPGIKRGDEIQCNFLYSITDEKELKNTNSIYVQNGKPYFKSESLYSHNSLTDYIDTLKIFDPDNDTVNIQILNPENVQLIEDSILIWKPENIQNGDIVNFTIQANDSYQSSYLSYELFMTEQNDTTIFVDDSTELIIQSPEMIFVPMEKFYYGNDSLYWINGTNQYLLKIQSKINFLNFQVITNQASSEQTIYDTVRINNDSIRVDTLVFQKGEFIQKTIAMPKDTVIFQPYRTSHHYKTEESISLKEIGDFYVSVYEISNEEYKNFVMDNGYNNDEYWNFELNGVNGINMKESKNWSVPKGWSTVNYYINSKSPLPDGPVCGISLYEAIAYSKWLSDKLGETYRLPTAEEWERISCGTSYKYSWETDSLIYFYPFIDYPWGMNFDSSYINCKKSDETKGVGKNQFIQGKSLDGLCHLLGNALEWTLTKNNEKYILKGGGFTYSNYTDIFHNKIIFRLTPESRENDTGFRLIKE